VGERSSLRRGQLASPPPFHSTPQDARRNPQGKLGLQESMRALSVRCGLGVPYMGLTDDQFFPCAMRPVVEIGIQRTGNIHNLTIDAAQVNPAL
jgi:hypothetical protein